MKNKKGNRKIERDTLALPAILIIGSSLLLQVLLVIFLFDTSNVIGFTAFLATAFTRCFFSFCLFVIVIVFFKPNKSKSQKIGYILMLILSFAAAAYLIRPVILDISYLDDPQVISLNHIEFDYISRLRRFPKYYYYLEGVDNDGKSHSFLISSQIYDEGRELEYMYGLYGSNIQAKASILPHTSVLMSVEYITTSDELAQPLYPPLPNLPDD